MAGGQGQCLGCGARPGEKCDPNGHLAPPAAERVDERDSEPTPPTFGECVEHARASLMAAEALLTQGGGALADVHANVAAGWGTLAMVLTPQPDPMERPAHRMRHFGGES